MPIKRRRNKYGAIRTAVDGITFASKKEAARYEVLRDMQDRGEISNLRLQVPYAVKVEGVAICRYYADFVYEQNGEQIVEDVKGRITPVYRLKKKLIKAVHGIDILET